MNKKVTIVKTCWLNRGSIHTMMRDPWVTPGRIAGNRPGFLSGSIKPETVKNVWQYFTQFESSLSTVLPFVRQTDRVVTVTCYGHGI